MVDCRDCDNFIEEVPIKVIDELNPNPLQDDAWHFEMGYQCTWNGNVSLKIENLKNGSCRCESNNKVSDDN